MDGSQLSPAAAAAAASAKAAGAGIVIDAGFSACYIVPFYDGQLLTQGKSAHMWPIVEQPHVAEH